MLTKTIILDAECEDKGPNRKCRKKKRKGKCQKKWAKNNCQLTCDLCDPTTPGILSLKLFAIDFCYIDRSNNTDAILFNVHF